MYFAFFVSVYYVLIQVKADETLIRLKGMECISVMS